MLSGGMISGKPQRLPRPPSTGGGVDGSAWPRSTLCAVGHCRVMRLPLRRSGGIVPGMPRLFKLPC